MSAVLTMSNSDKVVVVFREAAKHVPKAVGDALLELVSPANVAVTVAVFVAFAAGHALGYGWIIDIVAISGSLLLVGAAALEGFALLVDAVMKTVAARRQSDLEEAGRILAQAVLALGVSTVVALLTKKAAVKSHMAGAGAVASKSRYPAYRELRSQVGGSHFKGKFDAHHLWEKRFARLIGVAEDDIIAAPVLPRYHRGVNGISKPSGRPLGIMYNVIDTNFDVMITNYLQQRLRVPAHQATLQQVWVAHREVYLRSGQGNWAEAVYELYIRPRGIPFWGGAQ